MCLRTSVRARRRCDETPIKGRKKKNKLFNLETKNKGKRVPRASEKRKARETWEKLLERGVFGREKRDIRNHPGICPLKGISEGQKNTRGRLQASNPGQYVGVVGMRSGKGEGIPALVKSYCEVVWEGGKSSTYT